MRSDRSSNCCSEDRQARQHKSNIAIGLPTQPVIHNLPPLEHWSDGGETKLEYLLLLCRFHHGLVHEGGFGLVVLPDNEFRFTRPDGEPSPQRPEKRSRGNVFALINQNTELDLGIGPETPVPDWDSERMDDDLAVMGLLQCREDWFDNLGPGPMYRRSGS